MKKLTTAACAIALGLAWTAAPALAQAKAEEKADQIEKKAEQRVDQIEKQADQQADQIRKEGDRRADQVRGKTDNESVGDKMDRAWDKTRAKTREMTDKVTGDDRDHGRASADVRSAQQALQDRGFDPGPIDGVMGPRTGAAVRDFQQKENLTVTGQLDAETRARLTAGGAPAASPASEPSIKRQTR
jgi:Putative peptidoglycan binding domain